MKQDDAVIFIGDHSCNICGEYNESVTVEMLVPGTYRFDCLECGGEVVYFNDVEN